MNGKNKIFLDTAPIIYFLEKNETYGLIVSQKIKEVIENEDQIVISALCYGEYLTVPYRNKDVVKEKNFEKFIKDLNIIVYDINVDIMKIAAKLRAKHRGLKMPDAIQLATSKYAKCKEFLTNDARLERIKEVNTIILSWKITKKYNNKNTTQIIT